LEQGMAYELTEKGAFKRRGYGGVLTLSNGSGGTAGPTPEGVSSLATHKACFSCPTGKAL
jgi:hypothetical protein